MPQIREIEISNFKSIANLKLELGRFNVLIGENGCGKSNLLEAIAFLSCAMEDGKVTIENLFNKGVRVARPDLMVNAIGDKSPLNSKIEYRVINHTNTSVTYSFFSESVSNIYSEWGYRILENEFISEFREGKINATTFTKRLNKMNLSNRLSNVIDDNVIQGFKDALLKIVKLENKMIKLENKMVKEENQISSDLINKPYLDYLLEIVDWRDKSIASLLIYNLQEKYLRGISSYSKKSPLGINGEGLDLLLQNLDVDEKNKLAEYLYLIHWLEDYIVGNTKDYDLQGYKLGRSTSSLYFKDRFMHPKRNLFSAENANEGVLHILFYLTLFISKRTPSFFAIDNIETALNPRLCSELVETLAKLSGETGKQALITTHNPAVLDGLNLNDDEIRLFEVYRDRKGNTQVRRIQFKPGTEKKHKLSEMWMNGVLGAVPTNF